MEYSAYKLKWQLFLFNFKGCNEKDLNKFRRNLKNNFINFNWYNRCFITHSKTEADQIQRIAPKGCDYKRIEITDKQFERMEITHKMTKKEAEEFLK